MKTFIFSLLVCVGLSAKGAVNIYQTNAPASSFNQFGLCFGPVPTSYPLTLSGWVKPSVTNSSMHLFGVHTTTNNNVGFRLRIVSPGTFGLQVGDSSGSTSLTGTEQAYLGEWHHVCGVFLNPSNRLLYVNGRFSTGTTNGTEKNSFAANVFTIGGGRLNTNSSISTGATAELAKIGLWSAALTEDEIRSLASDVNCIPRFESLIEFWDLNQIGPKLGIEAGRRGNIMDFIHSTTYTYPAVSNGVFTSSGPTGRVGIEIPPVVVPPTWGGEVDRVLIVGDYTTNKITLTGSIAVGKTAVLLVGDYVGVTSVADSKGNTWTVNSTNYDTFGGVSVASAYITSGLVSGDVVTATMPSGGYRGRVLFLHYVNNAASSSQPDQATSATGFGTSMSSSASTTAANTALVGIVSLGDPSYTYSSSAWTAGTELDSSSRSWVPIYKDATASGSQNPSGTMSSSGTWFQAWVALK